MTTARYRFHREMKIKTMISHLTGHHEKINAIAVTPDGELILSASNDKTIRLWRAEDGSCHGVLQGHLDKVIAIAVTPNSQSAISGSKDGAIKLWDLKEGICLHTIEGHPYAVNSVAISHDGSFFVSGSSDCTLQQWNIQTGKCIRVFERHPAVMDRDGLNSLIRSSNTEFSYHDFIGHLGFAKTYNSDNFELFGHADPVTAVAISPDGRLLVSGSKDSTVRLWQIETGRCIWIFGGSKGGAHFGINDLVVTPDGRYVVAACDTLFKWRLNARRYRRRFWIISREKSYSHPPEINGFMEKAAIEPNGKRVVVLENNGSCIGLYQIRTGRRINSFKNPSDQATSITVTPDGRFAITGSISGEIREWKLF